MNSIKKLHVALLTAMTFSMSASAENVWVDVTNLIQNPNFSGNNKSDWTKTGTGTLVCERDIMSVTKGTWNISQTISNAPKGQYRLTVNGFHRLSATSNYSTDKSKTSTSKLFANSKTVALKNIYSESLTENYNNGCFAYTENSGWGGWGWGGTTYYYPNNTESAAYMLKGGKYVNTVNCTLSEDGDLKIGISNTTSGNDNWAAFTNFKLEYYAETTTEGRDKIVINEIQSSNVDQFMDPSWNFGGWMELYNPTSNCITLKGCYVSDDPNNLKKCHIAHDCAIAPGGHTVLWFDNHDQYTRTQLNMKLDLDGGFIYISDENGNILTSQEYPEAISRCSFARTVDGGNDWGWATTATPGSTNTGMTFAVNRLEAPTVNLDSQIFSGSLTVKVTIPSGATLRYTTDGSTPSPSHGLTRSSGTFTVNATSIYRFCLVQDGMLTSPVVTRSYILKDKDFTLPIISVVTEDANLYGDAYGILTKGSSNGRPGYGQSTACNWNMDWERPVNFEYLNQDGECLVNQEVGMTRCGGWSRAWTPYSFKLKANKRYELQNWIPYDFFPTQKPFLKHKTLQIRNGGNDAQTYSDFGGRMKDAALQQIIMKSGLYLDCQSYQPTMHYINGKYMGVINMREPNNKHYVYANYGLEDDEIDQFEMCADSGYVQKCGTKESFTEWYNLAKNAADDDTYEQIKEMVDIDAYINYMAVQLYLGGDDWPQNNIKGWKPIQEGGKWKFVVFDLDHAFNSSTPITRFYNERTHTFASLYGIDGDGKDITGKQLKLEIEFATIFFNMLKNDEFRKQFIDSFCLVAGSVFEPTRSKEIVTEMATLVEKPMSIANGYNNTNGPWTTANAVINKLSSRASSMISHLKGYSAMKLTSTTPRTITLSSDLEQAKLYLNDLPIPTNKFSGKLFPPFTVRASAPAGYRFDGWKLSDGTTTSSTQTLLSSASSWKYYAKGSLDGKNWYATDYSTTGWSTGKTPIGYNSGTDDRGFATTVSYGSDTNNKLPTIYLRNKVEVASLKSTDQIVLNYVIDDGFVIYVNGKEAGRYNMPDGTITYETFATTYTAGNPDQGTLALPTSLFHTGQNDIAIEVHNNSASSSDIQWECSIDLVTSTYNGTLVSTEETYEMPTTADQKLIACYSKMSEEEMLSNHINTAPVVINEVSAGNSVNINEYGKKDDWIELYNTTDQDIDLEGMYLTDKSEKPTKYQITGHIEGSDQVINTIIPAHGYKVIWCSKRDSKTQLHANFKLDNEDGKMVRIMAADESWADSLVYCAHEGEQTVGRYPDGGSETYLMVKSSILACNTMTTYCTAWEAPVNPDDPTDQPGEEDGISTLAHENGLALAYSNNELRLKSEDFPVVTLQLFSMNGTQVAFYSLDLSETLHGLVSVSMLPAGIYVARLTDSDGNKCSIKFKK